jgi:hypothetical protein
MVLNVSSQDYSLIIGGLNCTPALTHAEGNFSHYETGSGLIKISAKFTLKRAIAFTENLDDRINPRWARGKQIIFKINNFNAPVLGILYILNSQFDGLHTLEIEAGCILSLLNFRTPADRGICVFLGEDTSISSIAAKLLLKAGVTDYNLSGLPNRYLNIPLPKLSNESYISMFGQLCYSNGCIAYQDNTGTVNVKRINIKPTSNLIALKLGEHDIRYERLTGNEQPPEQIRCTGVKKNYKSSYSKSIVYGEGIDSIYRLIINKLVRELKVDFPQSAIPQITEITETQYLIGLETTGVTERLIQFPRFIDEKGRVIVDYSIKQQMLGAVMPKFFPWQSELIITEHKINIKYYEKKNPLSEGKCYEFDEGRLLTEDEYIYQPFGLVLATFLDNEEDRINTLGLTAYYRNLLKYFVEFHNQTTHQYRIVIPSSEAEVQEEKLIEYQVNTTKTQPSGILYNNLPDPVDTTLTGYLNSFPAQFIESTIFPSRIVEQTTEIYKLLKQDEWAKTAIEKKAFASALPDILKQMTDIAEQQIQSGQTIGNVKIPDVNTYHALITTNLSQKIDDSGSTTPPSPERFPIREISEKELIVIEKFPSYAGSNFKERERAYTVDSNFVIDKNQLQEIAKIEGAILLGKFKGTSCTTKLFSQLFDIIPLDGCSWQETSATHYFLIDGFSIAVTNKRVSVAWDGIWVGYGGGGGGDVIIRPDEIFSTIHTLNNYESESGTIAYYSYSLTSEQIILSGGESELGTIFNGIILFNQENETGTIISLNNISKLPLPILLIVIDNELINSALLIGQDIESGIIDLYRLVEHILIGNDTETGIILISTGINWVTITSIEWENILLSEWETLA